MKSNEYLNAMSLIECHKVMAKLKKIAFANTIMLGVLSSCIYYSSI